MSKRTPRLLLEDILDSAEKITQYIGTLDYAAFVADTKTFDAVIRNFEVIGEAANLLPVEFEEEYPSIDWHRIVGWRIHGYFGVDPSIVWQIIQHHLPQLRTSITNIINDY